MQSKTQNQSAIYMTFDMTSEIIESACYKQWLDDDGIFKTVFLPGTRLDLETAKEHIAGLYSLDEGMPHPLLVDIREVRSVIREARLYLARDPESIAISSAVALWVSSPLTRVIANFFLGLNQPVKLPVKTFTDEAAALEWLGEHHP